MTIQHLDLARATRRSDTITGISSPDYQILLNGIVQMLGKLNDISESQNIDDSLIEDQRSWDIRELRSEFGFAPDDEPVAHLRPLSEMAA